MIRTIRARYRNGVIEPLEEIDIENETEILVTIDVPMTISEEEKWNRFLSAAGGWKDIVDEGFLDEIYRQRDVQNRPEVKL